MGNLTDDFINSENWNYWRKRNKFLNENCLNCEVIGSCGGGCAMGSYNKIKRFMMLIIISVSMQKFYLKNYII